MQTVSMACSQALNQTIPHSELNGLRFTAQLAVTSPMLIGYKKCDVQVEKKSIVWIVLAAILLTALSYCYYGAVYYLPLGVATGIISSLVLILNYVISCIVTKSIEWYMFIASILCVLGVLMVTQPSFLFHNYNESVVHNMTDDNNSAWVSPCHVTIQPSTFNLVDTTNNTLYTTYELHDEKHDMRIGYVLCVSAVFITILYTQLLNQKLANINIYTYNFWVCLFGITASFLIMSAMEMPVFPNNRQCLAILIIHSCSAGLMSILFARMYQILDPALASLILTLYVVLTFILQYTLLSGIHTGHINLIGIIGSVSVFAGNALVPLCKLSQASRQSNL
jgi:drug/metabolite transporter (DMT)-like permease